MVDKKNGNTKWFDANVVEHKKVNEYEVLIVMEKYAIIKIPRGYHEIRIHTVFDVKHNGQHRAQVVDVMVDDEGVVVEVVVVVSLL